MGEERNPTHDPSASSHYISDEYYRDLIQRFSDWQTDEVRIDDIVLRDTCRRLLEREAWLLEQDRLDDWLTLYAPECLYWVPASPVGGDPRHEVAIAFDDRRRLEDRVFRLGNDYAWSQVPRSRTSRIVSNVTVYGTGDDAALMVRSNFLTTEFQAGDTRRYAGWFGHHLGRRGDGWQVFVKQVNLIDCDRNLRNPSIVL